MKPRPTAPARRSWYANLLVHPEFAFHLKHSVRLDLRAIANPVLDLESRMRIFRSILMPFRGRGASAERSGYAVTPNPIVRSRRSMSLPGPWPGRGAGR